MDYLKNLPENRFNYVIIAGMPKTGTTLPLTLLDNHPDLLVFPEELRFFNLGCDYLKGKKAADRFLNDFNIKMLSKSKVYFDEDNYLAHGGTGFGNRDYSEFKFQKFKTICRKIFEQKKSPRERFFGIVNAFQQSLNKVSERKKTFVCKAPHNELYGKKWMKLLRGKGKYIICTRLPTEHFISLKNVDQMQQSKRQMNIHKYLANVKSRRHLWDHFPLDKRFILDYDNLTRETERVLRNLCKFLGIKFHRNLTKPTKMGVPWSGNSSRGIVKKKVYPNKHKTYEVLSTKEIATIQFALKGLYKKMSWQRNESLSFFDKMKVKLLLYKNIFSKKVNSMTVKTKRLLLKHLPQRIITVLKEQI